MKIDVGDVADAGGEGGFMDGGAKNLIRMNQIQIHVVPIVIAMFSIIAIFGFGSFSENIEPVINNGQIKSN